MGTRKTFDQQNQIKQFSLKKRIHSFKFAFNGLRYFFKSQPNAWIHALGAFTAITMGIYFKISLVEWCLISFAIGFVFVSEIFNTSIEVLTNIVSPNIDPNAGLVKDLAAAAVLFAAFTALTIGVIVFWDKVL